jgi:hypothetical protein
MKITMNDFDVNAFSMEAYSSFVILFLHAQALVILFQSPQKASWWYLQVFSWVQQCFLLKQERQLKHCWLASGSLVGSPGTEEEKKMRSKTSHNKRAVNGESNDKIGDKFVLEMTFECPNCGSTMHWWSTAQFCWSCGDKFT